MKYNFEKSMSHSATNAMSQFVLTTSEKLKQTKDYKTISEIVYRLTAGGIPFVGKGYCISMADMMYTLLKQYNIKCHIVECSLTITNKSNNNNHTLIGFDNLRQDDGEDTHVVVVTETEIPMLIDMSIAHVLPNNIQCVIEEANSDENKIICNIQHENILLTYMQKMQYSIPLLHQTSIVDRIKTDIGFNSKIKSLKTLVVITIFISSINAIRGSYDFYSKFIDQENYWGPNAIEDISKRLENIENNIQNKH